MTQITKEYATALFALASEESCRQEIADALSVMEEAFKENSEFSELLSSPAIPIEERLLVIDTAFGALQEYAISFLKLLCEKGFVRCFCDISKEYHELLAAFSRVSTAKVTSAAQLTEEECQALIQKLTSMCSHEVVLETSVDASLLGGMIIEIDGKVIDASLRQKLCDIKDVIQR